MEPIKKETEKRRVSVFIPWRSVDGVFEFFLQKKEKDDPTSPGRLVLFGGGREADEVPAQTLLREVQEELTYTPVHFVYFSHYETARRIIDVFFEEVGVDFETKVSVQDGEYGIFKRLEDIEFSPEVASTTCLIIRQFSDWLTKDPTVF